MDTIYHYTTQDGFHSIIRSKEIWASDALYLNDSSELIFGLKRLAELSASRLAGSLDEEQERRLKTLHNLTTSPVTPSGEVRDPFYLSSPVFVTSFSRKRDMLSQWRAYCGGGPGYAIGFSEGVVATHAQVSGFYLAPCRYTEEEQDAALESFLVSFSTSSRLGYYPLVSALAATMKRLEFEAEAEVRLISKFSLQDKERLDYRPTKDILVPFYRLPLPAEGESLSIDEVVVGPGPHQDLCRRAARAYLEKSAVDLKGGVECSTVPLRW